MSRPKYDASRTAVKSVLTKWPNLQYNYLIDAIKRTAHCGNCYAVEAVRDLRRSGHVVGGKGSPLSWCDNPDPSVVHFILKKTVNKMKKKIGEPKRIKSNADDGKPVLMAQPVCAWLGI